MIELLLEERLGDVAARVYHDEDPAEIREDLRGRGRLQGDDDELAEALFEWVADDIGAEDLI